MYQNGRGWGVSDSELATRPENLSKSSPPKWAAFKIAYAQKRPHTTFSCPCSHFEKEITRPYMFICDTLLSLFHGELMSLNMLSIISYVSERLIMTKISATYLIQSFVWILGGAIFSRVCITTAARNLEAGEPIGVSLICSHKSTLNMKHVYRHTSSSSQTYCFQSFVRAIFLQRFLVIFC